MPICSSPRGLQNISRGSGGNSPVRDGDAANHGLKKVRLMDIPLDSSFIRIQSKYLNVHIQFQIEERSPGDNRDPYNLLLWLSSCMS